MFSWDVGKAQANYDKHAVAFEDAATVFADALGLDWDASAHSGQEARYKRLGRSAAGRILLIVYTIRSKPNDEETIRIISARQASRKERQAYAG